MSDEAKLRALGAIAAIQKNLADLAFEILCGDFDFETSNVTVTIETPVEQIFDPKDPINLRNTAKLRSTGETLYTIIVRRPPEESDGEVSELDISPCDVNVGDDLKNTEGAWKRVQLAVPHDDHVRVYFEDGSYALIGLDAKVKVRRKVGA